jgi:hypothetical protein
VVKIFQLFSYQVQTRAILQHICDSVSKIEELPVEAAMALFPDAVDNFIRTLGGSEHLDYFDYRFFVDPKTDLLALKNFKSSSPEAKVWKDGEWQKMWIRWDDDPAVRSGHAD